MLHSLDDGRRTVVTVRALFRIPDPPPAPFRTPPLRHSPPVKPEGPIDRFTYRDVEGRASTGFLAPYTDRVVTIHSALLYGKGENEAAWFVRGLREFLREAIEVTVEQFQAVHTGSVAGTGADIEAMFIMMYKPETPTTSLPRIISRQWWTARQTERDLSDLVTGKVSEAVEALQ